MRPNRELGPELPDRRQHPRRDRARGRARPGGRRARGGRRASGCCRSTSPRASATCTWWRSTARSSRRSRDALAPFANTTLHLADARRRSTSAALDPRAHARSWPTCPTAWPPPCSCKSLAELPEATLWRGDGPARGGRAARRRRRARRPTAPPRCSPSSRAEVQRAAQGVAHGLPPGAQRGLGAARAAPPRRPPSAELAASWCTPASPTGARRWRARSRSRRTRPPACASGARRAGGDRPARRRPRRAARRAGRASRGSPSCLPVSDDPASARPPRSTSILQVGPRARRRPARRSARSSPRSSWPTSSTLPREPTAARTAIVVRRA